MHAEIFPDPSKGRTEPFNCYPVPYEAGYDRILHHSKSLLRQDTSGSTLMHVL
jgi:hypothetical protein